MELKNGRMAVDPLNGKRVVVLGFARQGRALARWLPRVGAEAVISDSQTADQIEYDPADYPDVELVLGGHPEGLLQGADLLCLSGGVPLDLPIVQAAVRAGIPLSNDAQLFIERCPASVIGVTGSAGKTTTTTLVGAICERAGYTTWVGGNTGTVLLESLPEIKPEHRVIMELSSFQLEIMTVSPRLGTILNITPNHLDRHGSMEVYRQAKAQIIAHQTDNDVAVLAWDDGGVRALEDSVRGGLVWFSGRDMVADGAFLAGQRLILTGDASPDGDPHVLCERGDIRLRGDHNVLNVLAACAITGATGIAPEVLAAAIKDFTGVPHRLETVRAVNGVTYVNDSIATAPERVIAALRSYDEPVVLLLGGRDKKLPWEDLIKLALQKTRHIVAFGEVGDLVVRTIQYLHGFTDGVTQVATLAEAVATAAAIAAPGDVVLLSPGGTGFDAFQDFAERGEEFRRLVSEL
ncbi:MAG: UDP-N-acetylmuramoyl-L-alanine--D-glutamate ligase [Chloroflexi bacterium]|nr:UDP-N-acetylmuramoyl-L-alanine--D-glutamate ligase [Chloroflexota bacterium]